MNCARYVISHGWLVVPLRRPAIAISTIVRLLWLLLGYLGKCGADTMRAVSYDVTMAFAHQQERCKFNFNCPFFVATKSLVVATFLSTIYLSESGQQQQQQVSAKVKQVAVDPCERRDERWQFESQRNAYNLIWQSIQVKLMNGRARSLELLAND